MTTQEPASQQYPIEELHVADDVFPRTYAAKLGAGSAPNWPGPFSTCWPVSPKCDANVRLNAINPNSGRLWIQIVFYDNYQNYPGMGMIEMEGPVSLKPNIATKISQVGGKGSCTLYSSKLQAPAMMQIGFSVPWAARKNGAICFSGTILFSKQWVNLTRVGLVEEGGDATFGPA